MKRLILSIVAATALLCAHADEGMWMICNLSPRTDSLLHAMGLELTHDQIYNEDGSPALNNAIVQFGGFCSGVVVSPDGLVFTNHHCGYGSIQEHSSTKHDYLEDGFVAKHLKDELPNDGLYVDFHLGTWDVTDRIMSALTPDMDARQRAMATDSVMTVLTEVFEDAQGRHAEIVPYYKGSRYYMSLYQRFDDVRLVYAPPQCLGKHGGDTDNWVWPRQTCDFSVFRIYANKDNNPAAYSKDNVPYHPVQYAHVSTEGYEPGSFCMTFGYPGSTDRYLSSFGIQNTMHATNDVRMLVRDVKLGILRDAMAADQAVRIQYASKYAQCSNYWKFSIGQNKALKELDVIGEKEALEKELSEWIAADSLRTARYGSVLDSLRNCYARSRDYDAMLWQEAFYGGSDILKFALNDMLKVLNDNESDLENRVKEARKTYKDIDFDTDRRVFAAMLQTFRENLTEGSRLPDIFDEIDKNFGGNCDAYARYVYLNSRFCNADAATGKAFLKMAKDGSITEDPMFRTAASLLEAFFTDYYVNNHADDYECLLGEAIREMNADKEYYPDANFTLRMSYGQVGGYTPDGGTPYGCYTSVQSIIDKYEQQGDNLDYRLTAPVYDWLKKGTWDKRWKDSRSGEMQLCFLTNNDITGGNSGSGMFDGKGRLIGLAFDGNWEAMSGDIKFDTSLQRCIGVDIRYVLSVIESYGHASRLINELTLE